MKILVILAYPNMGESRLNARLRNAVLQVPNIRLRELYKEYPNEQIDVKREQQLLESHDRIVFQFPNYWYSYPPLLKKWFDLVLERGWAFRGRHALQGKEFGVAISSGFTAEDYRFDGLHRHSIEQILAPFYATCHFIQVKSLPVFNTFEEEMETEEALNQQAEKYLTYLNNTYRFYRKS